MKIHGSSVRKFNRFVILLLAVSASRGQQTPRNQSGLAAPSGSKPQLVVTPLDGAGGYSLTRSCETGRPMLFVKVRVTNQSPTPSPAVPASDGIVLRDATSQVLTGAAGLPAIPGGATVVVVVPVKAPPNPTTISGRHEFRVAASPRRLVEEKNFTLNSAGPVVVNVPSGFCASPPAPLKLPSIGQRTQPPQVNGALAANQAAAHALKQTGGISNAASAQNAVNQPSAAKTGVASVNAVTGLGGTPYAKPEAWNLDLESCGLNGPIGLSAPIYEPAETNQGGWATGVLNAVANLTPDSGELAQLANPIDLWFGEALADDTAQCPFGPPQRVANPSIQISIPVTLTSSGLQQTGIEYGQVNCGPECVPPYISEGTTAVYLARIEDCLSDADHRTLKKVLDYTGNPIPCNTADGVLGNAGFWYDVATPWAATATLGFTDCQDAPNCVPPDNAGTVVSGTLTVPAQLPVPANSLRIEIAFGLQDYYSNSFVQLYWGPNLGLGPEASWGGPEPQALTRFAVQLQPIIVLPAAFMQMKVLPYTIVYQPPGDQSTGSYTATQSFGTVATIGKSTTLGNTKSVENSLNVQDGKSISLFIGSIQQNDGQSQTLSQTWDHNATFGKGLTDTASHTTVRTFSLGDKGLTPGHEYAQPTTCSGDNWSVNCSVLPAEQYKQEPFWDDRIVLLLNPQAAVWDFNGTPAMQLLGGADFDLVSITDLAACAGGQGNGGGWTLSNQQVLTPQECQQLMQLDPFANPMNGGQAYDPSQSGRGLYLGGASYGHDPLNYNSDSNQKFSDVFSYTTARSTNATATYDATVTDTVGFSWSSGLKLSYQYGQYGLNVGFSADVTVTQGEKTTSGTSMKTTYSPSTVATDTNATEVDGAFDDDHDFGLPDCTHKSPVNCYQPHVNVYLDELFGSYMFQDRNAVRPLKVSTTQALPPPGPPQPSIPPQVTPQLLSAALPPPAAPQPALANSTLLVPSNAFQGGVLTGMVIGPDNQPVPNTPVEIAGGVPVTLTGEVIGDQPPTCAPGDTSCQPAPPQTPQTRQTASSTPPLVNCAKVLASPGQNTSTPPAGVSNPAAAPSAPSPVLTDAAGRFALCVAPNAPTVAVNIPGVKVTVNTVANQAPPLPSQPPTFFQPGQVISVAGSIANLVGTQNNNSWRLYTVGAWSPDGRQTITAFQAPQQAQPGALNLSYTGSDGRSHQVQASVFKILRASLDRSQLHSNQGTAFEYEIQFAGQTGQNLCVEMHSAGPVVIVQQPPGVIAVDSAGLGRFSGRIRATQVMPGAAVPFELTPNIHACGQPPAEQVGGGAASRVANALPPSNVPTGIAPRVLPPATSTGVTPQVSPPALPTGVTSNVLPPATANEIPPSVLLPPPQAQKGDDNENTTPTTWWMYSSQTAAMVDSSLVSLNARIVDIKYDNFSPFPFTTVLVPNTGAYKKGDKALWYYGLDAPALKQKLQGNRLISLKAYDIGQGQVRYTVSMIPNTGADYKEPWYFCCNTPDEITNIVQQNNARLTSLESFRLNGETRYAGIMIPNTGADAKGWWWYYHKTPQFIGDTAKQFNARLLDVTYAEDGTFNAVMESCSGGCPKWSWWYDQSFDQMLAIANQNNARIITADTYPDTACGSYCFVSVMMEGSVPGNHGKITARLRGFVDLHTHPLSNLGFGGLLIYGGVDVGSFLPHDPACKVGTIATSVYQALGEDKSTHGGWNFFSNGCGNDFRELFIHQFQQNNDGAADEDSDARGTPDFKDWPLWNDITHQKMWVDWIYRAYHEGGLRVMVALAVNNKTLGDVVTGANIQPLAQGGTGLFTDDKSSADVQITSIKEFVGRHDVFMAMAYSSDDLKRIVNSNKLAVILGVEIDKIGNFDSNSPTADADISAEIARLYSEGVRYVFPVHVIDNAFGGTAAYEDSFNYSNRRESGNWWDLICDKDGSIYHKITYKFTPQGAEFLLGALVTLGLGAANDLRSPPDYEQCTFGQRNQRPMSAEGGFAIKEMMRHGMLIDFDHMSQATFEGALWFVQQQVAGGYPLMSGHSNIRLNGGSERNPKREHYLALGNLQGMTGVGSAKLDACAWTMQATKILQAMDFDPTNGQVNTAGIGFGTDTDGLAIGMPPSASKTTPAVGNPVTMAWPNQQHIFYRDDKGDVQHVFWDDGKRAILKDLPPLPWVGPDSLAQSPPAAGDPAPMNWQNQQQHLFYRDTQNNIWNYSWGTELWAGGNGSSTTGPAAAGNPAVMMTGNQQHMFYRDTSGNIWQVVWDSNKKIRYSEQWTGPNGKSQALIPAAGDPALMLWKDQQHIFYRDVQNNIEHVWWDPSGFGSWQGPQIWASGTGNSTTGPAAAGNPAAMVTPTEQHIFYRSTDGSIWHVVWDDGQNARHAEAWAGPASTNNAPKAAGDPATMVVSWDRPGFNCVSTEQNIFYRDTSNRIQHVMWEPRIGGLCPAEVWAEGMGDSDKGTGPAAAGDPATLVWPASGAPKEEHIFYRSAGGGIWHVYFGGHGLQAESWAPERDPQAAASLASDKNFGEYCDYYRPPLPLCTFAAALRSECLNPYTFGTRTWDYNNDGVAHYGMLPDFLTAVRTIPSGADLVDNGLMYGAEYLYQTWRFAEKQSANVK